MPGFYKKDEYDISGTVVGVLDKKNLLSNRQVQKGDILIGLESTGLHTNGYSLARNVLLNKFKIDDYIEELGCTVAESLLAIHKSYLQPILPIINNENLHALSHITGGGIIANTLRVIDKNNEIIIDWDSWERPPIFKLIQDIGNVPEYDMRESMNLGIGMIMIVDSNNLSFFENHLNSVNQSYKIIGNIK